MAVSVSSGLLRVPVHASFRVTYWDLDSGLYYASGLAFDASLTDAWLARVAFLATTCRRSSFNPFGENVLGATAGLIAVGTVGIVVLPG